MGPIIVRFYSFLRLIVWPPDFLRVYTRTSQVTRNEGPFMKAHSLSNRVARKMRTDFGMRTNPPTS